MSFDVELYAQDTAQVDRSPFMTGFIPRGYISIDDALDYLGREQFHSEWTGDERSARTGLIGIGEWLRIRDLAPARGSDAGIEPPGQAAIGGKVNAPHRTGDPSSDSYQKEYQACSRYQAASDHLRDLLEGGDLEAAIWDPFTGIMHRAGTNLWRRSGADRLIKKGDAPIPRSPNKGSIIIKDFRATDAAAKPFPAAKIREAIKALKGEMANKSLTRPQQRNFLRRRFSGYNVTERQFTEIFQSVKVHRGRPKQKSDTIVA